tara:strand:+ start:352 stop:630 length:279 start_codon:yes stop_codon:yes gene_type:complete
MAIILIETTSTSAANSIVSEVQAGSLWSVDMGTTSKAAAYSDRAMVECTNSRADSVVFNCPPESIIAVFDSEPPSFTAASKQCQIWFLRGKI